MHSTTPAPEPLPAMSDVAEDVTALVLYAAVSQSRSGLEALRAARVPRELLAE